MSELTIACESRNNFRRQLMITVCAFALLGVAGGAREVKAADDGSDRPTVWIELGGQLERIDDGEERFAPPFVLATPRPRPETISPLSVEHPARYDIGGEGKLAFAPADTNWVFSAAVRYGRANSDKHAHQQSYPTDRILFNSHVYNFDPRGAQSTDTKAQNEEDYTIVDFQAGKDVGLGMFGGKGSSVLSAGIRFAQFASNANIALKTDPDFHIYYHHVGNYRIPFIFYYHSNSATANISRSFRGLGPSISWNASAPVMSGTEGSGIALDWGVNAAILFGRQKAKVHHQTTSLYHAGLQFSGTLATVYRHVTPVPDRSRSVTVPNVGGFAGISFRYAAAKVSFGYRGDFFFDAMDGGIDTAKKTTIGLYGPFANISIGFP